MPLVCDNPSPHISCVAMWAPGSNPLSQHAAALHALPAAVIGHLLSTCPWAYSAASSALWWAASLPPSCKESLAHATLKRSGATTRYFIPGLWTTCFGLGLAVAGHSFGVPFPTSRRRTGHLGRRPCFEPFVLQFGGPAQQALGSHTGPTPPSSASVLGAER